MRENLSATPASMYAEVIEEFNCINASHFLDIPLNINIFNQV